MKKNKKEKGKILRFFLPQTKLGKISVWLITVSFLLLALMRFFVFLGQRGGETFFDNLYLGIPGILAGISIISAFFIGIWSIIKYKERSVFVFISTLIGLIGLFFLIGEITVPH
ncbi:MAG: hypothetical protein V1663_00265 [archaeon]